MSKNYLERLKVYGCDEIEDVVLAGLVSGDPVLLVGTHGSAKTMLCENIAKALGLRFIAYDASKALFEDVLGYPDPFHIKEGKVRYVQTPISIQNREFVLIDEISRASYQMQSKWLEVIRSRRIMGENLENLKYVFAAMNPPGYPGTRPLDSALSGRFAYIVWMPEYGNLKKEHKEMVMRNISKDDALLLHKSVGLEEDVKLVEFLEKAREIAHDVESNNGEQIENFVNMLEKRLKERNYMLDGRRAGMIRRSLICIASVKIAKGNEKEEAIRDAVLLTKYLLPYPVEDEMVSLDDVEIIVRETVLALYRKLPKRELLEDVQFSKLEQVIKMEGSLDKKYIALEKIYDLMSSNSQQINKRFLQLHANLFPSGFHQIWAAITTGENTNIISPVLANGWRLATGLPIDDRHYGRNPDYIGKIAEEIQIIANRRKGGA
ncbi:MAG: MoxR family ATPase [Thermoplasmata archaeon]